MNAATPGSESKFVMTNVLDTDPVSGLWHQIAVYPPRLLVEFGIKFILGHIYTSVVRMNTDGSKQVVPYNSAAPWTWYTISKCLFKGSLAVSFHLLITRGSKSVKSILGLASQCLCIVGKPYCATRISLHHFLAAIYLHKYGR